MEMRNPVMLASCILGDSGKNLKSVWELGIGAVVSKTITMEPRIGHPDPIMAKQDGGYINAVGLGNQGAAKFAEDIGIPDYPLVVSLAGTSPGEFTKMVGLFKGIMGFDINLSCPNANFIGDCVGNNAEPSYNIIKEIKSKTDLPVFAKISHDMDIKHLIDAKIDGITAINTILTIRYKQIIRQI